jgi:2-furoate---CoA ligase
MRVRANVQPTPGQELARPHRLASFKRPRRYVFVEEIPRSPVGKLLRRRLVNGEYTPESSAPAETKGSPV